jgi:hypothetical protein
MVDERIGHIWRPIMAKSVACAPHNRLICFLGRSPAVQTLYFILAVAVVSTIIFALSMRADRASSDGGSSDPGVSSTNDGWVASWFGPTHSGDIRQLGQRAGWSGGDRGGGGGGSSD